MRKESWTQWKSRNKNITRNWNIERDEKAEIRRKDKRKYCKRIECDEKAESKPRFPSNDTRWAFPLLQVSCLDWAKKLPGLSKKAQLRKVFIQMGTDQPFPMDTLLTCCANIICSAGPIWGALHWLHFSKLADMDTFSKSDPFAVLFIQVRRTKYNLEEVWTDSS